MISNKAVTWYSYASLVVMAVFLVLMWQRMVPEQWYMSLFALALVLFLVRVTLRLMLARQSRLEGEARASKQGGERGS